MGKNTFLAALCILALLANTEIKAQGGWTAKANYGGGVRTRASGFSIGGNGYILAGLNGVMYKDVWEYDTTTNAWSSKSSFGGTAREGAGATAIGGNGYIIGGKDGSGFEADVWKYYPNTDSWSSKTACPGGGRYFAVCVADSANGNIYYGCGDNGGSTYLSDWWVYTPSTDTWKSLTAFPGGQRSYGVGFCLNGEIYMGTGNDESATLASSDWWKYDPGTDSWTSVASVPGSTRREASAFAIGNYGYVCLGLSGTGSGTAQSDLWMYDPIKNTWTQEASYGGGAASDAVAFTIGYHAYVGTGLSAIHADTNQFFEYTPDTNNCNIWISKANYGGGVRTRASGFSIGGNGYILAGLNGVMYKDVWEYDTTTNAWSSKSSFGGTAREGAGATAIGGNGYIIGGKDGSGFEADVWKYYPNTDSWSSKTACPGGGRYFAVCVADSANGNIYYGCGDNGGSTYLSDWWVYTPSTDTWKSLTAFPGGQRSYGVGFCLNGEIYMGTGNDESATLASSDWWKYDPGTDSWTSVASVPGSTRREASAFAIGNYGYVCLGLSGTGSGTAQSDLWMYDPIKNTWTQEASYGGGAASDAVAFTIGNNAYVGTGLNSSHSTSSQFWEYTSCSSGPSSINEVNTQEAVVSVFPNPASGIINFTFSGNQFNKVTIEVIDIFGRLVDTHENIDAKAGTARLDESTLTNGIYFYRITGTDKSVNTGKFVIER